MKLKLAHDRAVLIIGVTEVVADREVEVLRAGVLKILASGRALIVLDLSTARGLNASAIAALLPLRAAAEEKGGRLALVGQGDLVREAFAVGDDPRHPLYFPTRSAASSALNEKRAPAPGANPALNGDANGALKTRLAKLSTDNAALKAKVAALGSLQTLRELRRDNGRLEQRLAALETLRTSLREERRPAFGNPEADRRFEAFSRTLALFLGREGVLPRKAGDAG